MPVYDVSVRQGASLSQNTVVARSPAEARLLASRYGVVIGMPKVCKEGLRAGMTPSERYVFLHQLATMNYSRVPLSDSLQTLRRIHGGRIGRAAASLEAGVAAGKQIADLMVEDKKNFPGAVGLLVKAGSKGLGGTAQALIQAAEFERQILTSTTSGIKGLWKAFGLMLLSTVCTIGIPVWGTPYMQESDAFKATSTPIRWDGLDSATLWSGIIMGLLMVVFIFFFVMIFVGQRLWPHLSDAVVIRVPYVRDLVFARDNYIALYRFSLMVQAGVSLEEALLTTVEDTREGALKRDFRQALADVKLGRPWADSFRTMSEIDRKAMAMASDKERLGKILMQVADQNKAIYTRRLEALAPALGVISALSLMVLMIVVNLYSIIPFSELISKMMDEASSLS